MNISAGFDYPQRIPSTLACTLKYQLITMWLTANIPSADAREYAIWLISLALVAFGFRFARQIIALLLEKLHEIFIQQNSIM